MQTIGTILQLARYPVKSMRGEALSAAMLSFQGVSGDRRYAFVQAASRSDFPWLTARQFPDLLRYEPAIEQDEGEEGVVTVTTPLGEKWPVDGAELRQEIEERSGRALFLLRQNRGSYDAAPISIISRQTVARIAEESKTVENWRRFRPSLLLDLHQGGPFGELNWVGRILQVGETARVAIMKADHRCLIITLDPDSTEPSPEILRYVAEQHESCAGIYATVITPGEVHPGDSVRLESP